MKRFLVAGLIFLAATPAFGDGPSKASLVVYAPNVAQIKQQFQVEVYLNPAPDSQVTTNVHMELEPYLSFSPARFSLQGSKHEFLTAKITSDPRSGLAWINAYGDNGESSGWAVVDVSFDGHLKPSWTDPVAYDRPTTLSLDIIDRDGKPIPFDGDLELKLDSSDALINDSPRQVVLQVPPYSRASPLFRLKPLSPWGGQVHLSGALSAQNYTLALAQGQFVFTSGLAWWVPVLLAFFGGMLHAAYKIVKTPLPIPVRKWLYASVAIVGTSSVSSLIGYLFANFDLFGLKLDHTVLQTYVIVGFLFSYFGVEALLSDKLSLLTASQLQSGHPPENEVSSKSRGDADPIQLQNTREGRDPTAEKSAS